MHAHTVRMLLRAAGEQLAATSREPQRDAAALLGHTLGKDRTWLLAHPEAPVEEWNRQQYAALLARRAQHEPIQYILGEQEFYGLRLRVTPDVLIPRPETEHLVEAVLARLPHDRALRLADVGTGSGAVALALAQHLPLAHIDALDLSHEALLLAQGNAASLQLDARVEFVHSDLLTAVRGRRYDCIVSNPPYVPAEEALEPQVAGWEPHTALFADEDGLGIYRRLLPQVLTHLAPGGLFAGELGQGQSAALAQLFSLDARWLEPVFLPDLQAIPRIVIAFRALRDNEATTSTDRSSG